MPKGSPAPWFRECRRSWFVTIGGKQINLKTADKREANRRWHELAIQAEEALPFGSRLTARELLALFLEWAEKHTRPASYDWYSYFLKCFVRAVPATLAAKDVRAYRVTQWLDSRAAWKDGSRRGAICAVKRAFQWGVQEGFLDFSPIAALKKPPRNRRETILTPMQRDTIVAAARDENFRDFLTLIQETGARPHEVRTVEARHVDAARRLWVFPPEDHKTGRKTGRPRVVYLTPKAWAVTEQLLGTNAGGPLCRNAHGLPWTASAIRQRFMRLRKRLTGKVPPDLCAYLFRHTFATDALERGVDAVSLAELMGHRDTSMISHVYQHLDQKVEHLHSSAVKATRTPAARAAP
jgi:integrase